MNWQGHWIWTSAELAERNTFVRFRRCFDYNGGGASLNITADSRYVVYVNGEYLGQGPVRAWPGHWRYDTYDLQPHLKLGENTVAILVNHYGESNFQYIQAPQGLLAQIEVEDGIISTDDSWLASPDASFVSVAPRIDVQEGFEEQYDGRLDDGWVLPGYDDASWSRAKILRPADDGCHMDMAPRGIPFLTMEPVLPQRVVEISAVSSISHHFSIQAKPYLAPNDVSSNRNMVHAYLATQVWSPADVDVELHRNLGEISAKLNGLPADGSSVRLSKGWNSLMLSIRGFAHLPQYVVSVDGPTELKFCATGDVPGAPWALVGPFGLSDDEIEQSTIDMDESLIVVGAMAPSATCARGEAIWNSGDVASITSELYFQQIRPEHLPSVNVFAQAYTDRIEDARVVIDHADGLISGSEWTTVNPAADGHDVRILLDFGREVVGYHRFDIDAPAGTIVDFHNFEFIQPDGRHNFAEGMNNSFRYICREGRQAYQTNQRRGFQYSYLILRNMTGPVKLHTVEVLFSTYPQSHRGSFASSDTKLNRIWEVGAHTLRCCAEDTYTDCPTYEQTHWVGDARNEALIDWVINGDPRLWYRCLEQTGDSLDRSSITESEVPSGWINILPAWSFLWMRSCREFLLFSGDEDKSRRLLQFIERNIEGIKGHLNSQGLFDIRGWNMFDWAAMDTPGYGVVTHQNCFAVLALHDAAEMAEWLGECELAHEWTLLAGNLAQAINSHLWNEDQQAYTDCLRDGAHSSVYSQQTQTIALMSGVAAGDRADRCRDIVHNPPEGFVTAGSPFFEFFLLESYQSEGRQQEFIDTIRKDWGFMVDKGASTFWEMWSVVAPDGRLTRSHCHGWSAAPTFFLSTYVLGVRPGGRGFSPVIIEPHPGDIGWCRGFMPTPAGDIGVQWENEPGEPFVMRVTAPEGIPLEIRLPRDGSVTVNGVQA